MSQLASSEQLSVMPLGAGNEVGRSCIVVRFKGKTVMLDCGIHPAHSGLAALPFFDEIDPASVDVVLITHFHLDHAAGLPYFMEKTGFKGKVFMTHPTKAIYKWLLADYVRVSGAANDDDDAAPGHQLYSEGDLARSYERITAVDYHQEVEVEGIKFYALNAGHVLGAAMFMLEIAGARLLYTGDYSREEDRHLMAAETPKERPDVLVCESTYGVHTHQPRLEREMRFTSLVHEIVGRGGRCLIPVFALGRAQELLLILDEYWNAHPELHSIPVYYASSLAKKCMAVYQTYVNMMNERIRRQVAVNNPFLFRHVSYLRNAESFTDSGPCVMMASPAMLQSGLSRELLERWAPSALNGLVVPGYVVEGTLAKHVLTEPKEIQFRTGGPNVPLRMSVEYISFSAHVDFTQNAEFMDLLQPPHIVLVHGEAGEMHRLKSALIHRYSLSMAALSKPDAFLIGTGSEKVINVHTPRNCEPLELYYRGERTVKLVGGVIRSLEAGASVEGVLVGRDFEYRLVAPNELSEYVQGLKIVSLRERQAITCRAPFSLVEYLLSQFLGSQNVTRQAECELILKQDASEVLLQSDGADSFIVEWDGNPTNDLLADSVVMLLLGADSSRLAVKVTKGNTSSCSSHHISTSDSSRDEDQDFIKSKKQSPDFQQKIIKSFLENKYGHISTDKETFSFEYNKFQVLISCEDFVSFSPPPFFGIYINYY